MGSPLPISLKESLTWPSGPLGEIEVILGVIISPKGDREMRLSALSPLALLIRSTDGAVTASVFEGHFSYP